MTASLSKAFTSPLVGQAATGVAVALAVALAVVSARDARREAELRGQLASLTEASARASQTWRAELAGCHTEAARRSPAEGAITRVIQPGEDMATRLASQGPAGIDVCARMEAADAAVMVSLGNR
ncbi:hypothetical protein [Phenylobacterium soli]|uniref:hypothetical protein n=1 Tax=Phenylobacterium soli TaxID=2170551 RepID=UPI00360D6E2B